MRLGSTALLLLSTLFLSPRGFALGIQEEESTSTEAPSAQVPVPDVPAELLLQVGSHLRLTLPRDAVRVAVGSEETVTAELLSSQELLLLGLAPGVSSLIIWYEGLSPQSVRLEVEPNLTLLRETLKELDPSLSVKATSQGRVLVLRGEVAEPAMRQLAESAAVAFLDGSNPDEEPLLATGEGSESEGWSIEIKRTAENDARNRPRRRGTNSVLNLIRVLNLPDPLEVRLAEALVPLCGDSVQIRRVQQGQVPNDALDLFVLEGKVPDQVTLSRVLFLASRVVDPEGGGRDEVRALADESGALAVRVQNALGALSGGGGGGQNQNLNLTTGAGGSGAPTLNANTPLLNRIGTNLGRAKLHEAAGGRVLSMIEVEDLPLVRVDLRLYEVNLGRLRQWRNDLGIAVSDFSQGNLPPGDVAQSFQGDLASTIGEDDIQNVLGFLDGGLSNQLQLVSGGFSVDGLFQMLVEQDVARSLSRPTLTVLSGELALFQVGGQIPVPVAVTLGGGTDQVLSGVEFQSFGVQLAVRPMVEETDQDTITLDLSPLVSLPDLDLTAAIGAATGTDVGATAFETRGTLTHARLRDGEALVLGGLISREEAEAVSRAPWLGNIPGLGWLFRNESSQARETELVIVVNPVIVRSPRPESQLWEFPSPEAILQDCLDEARGATHDSEPVGESSSSQSGAKTVE